MTITFWELPSSGSFSKTGQEFDLVYALKGTSDRLEALAHIVMNTETEVDGVPRVNITGEPVDGHNDLWSVTVSYAVGSSSGSLPTSDIGEERTRFTTRSGQKRIFQAISHIADYANTDIGENPPNHGGAINVTNEGIEGIEIDDSGFSFEVSLIVADSGMTTQYNQALFEATNKVNSTLWRGYEPGELRLVGVEANQRDLESWEVVFEFLAYKNVQDVTIGDIDGVSKLGHELAWAEHAKLVDETTNPPTIRSKVKAVHIEQVYDYYDFSVGLGLSP